MNAKTTTYIKSLAKAETDARKAYDAKATEASQNAAEAAKVSADLEAAKASQNRLEEALRGGDTKVSTSDLLTATAEVHRQSLLLEGWKARSKAPAKPVSPDIAHRLSEAIKGVYGDLVSVAVSTLTPPAAKRDITPLIVVTQSTEEKQDPKGAGYATVQGIIVRYFRSSLHAALDPAAIRSAAEGVGIVLAGTHPRTINHDGFVEDAWNVSVTKAAPSKPPTFNSVLGRGVHEFVSRSFDLVALQRLADDIGNGYKVSTFGVDVKDFTVDDNLYTYTVELSGVIVPTRPEVWHGGANSGVRTVATTGRANEDVRNAASRFPATSVVGDVISRLGLITSATGGARVDEEKGYVIVALDLEVKARSKGAALAGGTDASVAAEIMNNEALSEAERDELVALLS